MAVWPVAQLFDQPGAHALLRPRAVEEIKTFCARSFLVGQLFSFLIFYFIFFLRRMGKKKA